MAWVLVVLVFVDSKLGVMPNGAYESMNKCFEARELFMATAPKPKINYDAICVRTDQLEML